MEIDPTIFSSDPVHELPSTDPYTRSGVPVEEMDVMTPSQPLAGATQKRIRGPAKAVEITGDRTSRKSKRLRGVKLAYSKDLNVDTPVMDLLTTVVDISPATALPRRSGTMRWKYISAT